jgi:hypothetical protein
MEFQACESQNHGGRCGLLKPFLKQQTAIYFSASRHYRETTVSGPSSHSVLCKHVSAMAVPL